MTENTKILTGSTAKVEAELNKYLASHPNATVLSHAVTTGPVEAPAPAETTADETDGETKPAKKQAKHKPEMIEGVIVSVIVGIKY